MMPWFVTLLVAAAADGSDDVERRLKSAITGYLLNSSREEQYWLITELMVNWPVGRGRTIAMIAQRILDTHRLGLNREAFTIRGVTVAMSLWSPEALDVSVSKTLGTTTWSHQESVPLTPAQGPGSGPNLSTQQVGMAIARALDITHVITRWIDWRPSVSDAKTMILSVRDPGVIRTLVDYFSHEKKLHQTQFLTADVIQHIFDAHEISPEQWAEMERGHQRDLAEANPWMTPID